MNTPTLFRKVLVPLFTLLIGLSLQSGTAHAQATGDLDLQGIVASSCSVTVSPVVGVADALDLSAAATNVNVASVNETCNDPDGYTVTAVSANASTLMPVGASSDSVAFTINYGGAAADLSGTTPVTDVTTNTGSTGVDKTVDISYANPGFIAADTYQDTITFTIAAK